MTWEDHSATMNDIKSPHNIFIYPDNYAARQQILWLVGENVLEVFHHYAVHYVKFQVISKGKNTAVFLFPFHAVIAWSKWFICLQELLSILSKIGFPNLYPLINPCRRMLALFRVRILIAGSIRSSPMLTVYEVYPVIFIIFESIRHSGQHLNQMTVKWELEKE